MEFSKYDGQDYCPGDVYCAENCDSCIEKKPVAESSISMGMSANLQLCVDNFRIYTDKIRYIIGRASDGSQLSLRLECLCGATTTQ